MDYIVCHYSEIGLKGKNRKFFEQRLIQNIKRLLNPSYFRFVKRISGRVIIKLTSEGEKNKNEIQDCLKCVFGLAYFTFATRVEQELKSIQEKLLEMVSNRKFNTFRVLTQRSNKSFYLTSPEINKKVGGWLNKRLKKKIDLKDPELTCYVEIVEKYAFLYLEKIKGPGGLPIGVGGKALCLVSGGIDSPVAAFNIMRRGVKILFVHFHAYPYTNKASIKKVRKIIGLLNKFQGRSNLYLIPFADIQKQIFLKAPVKLRVVLYRRAMTQIAQEIGKKEKVSALVTGENLGQVASQTIENIKVITQAIELPILRPLIGQDKQDIVTKAKQIGTYKISILPDQDCCSRFLPKHPETKANFKEVQKAEKKIKMKKLVKCAVREAVKEAQ